MAEKIEENITITENSFFQLENESRETPLGREDLQKDSTKEGSSDEELNAEEPDTRPKYIFLVFLVYFIFVLILDTIQFFYINVNIHDFIQNSLSTIMGKEL
jgi:hypothetical protein